MLRNLFLLLLLFSQVLLLGKLPDIKPVDVRKILTQIMESHVSHKELTPTLVQRALEIYLEELDPMKTYFLASEIEEWLNPSQNVLEKIGSNAMKKDFSTFFLINDRMIEAIARRNRLEETLASKAELPKDVSIKEFKKLEWVETEEPLFARLLRIKALQTETAEKLDKATMEKALQRIKKRRLL